MRHEARQTLNQIRKLSQLETLIRCARAELASIPNDERLAEFIRSNEKLLNKEREKLRAA